MIVVVIMLFIIIFLLLIILGRYFVIAPKRKVVSANSGQSNVKILFFSDLHLGSQLKKKRLAKIIDRFDKDVDVVIFGGDLVGKRLLHYYSPEDLKELFSPFSHIKYRFFVLGNHEQKLDRTVIENIVEKIGFTLLVNQKAFIEKDGQRVIIYGVDEMIKGHSKLEEADIYIVHQPDYFVNIGNGLTLSGHSHGGQITFFGYRIYIAKFSRFYRSGQYTNGTKQLIVSNGIGTNFIPLRLFARSDFYLIDYRFSSNQKVNK